MDTRRGARLKATTLTCESCAAEVKVENMAAHMEWHLRPSNAMVLRGDA